LPAAIAIPIKKVPKNKKTIEEYERIKIPAVNNSKLQNRVRSIPMLAAILGTRGEKAKKAKSGNVESKPAKVWDMPVSFIIEPSTGPTEVREERKLAAIKKIPTTKSTILLYE
jgi:hypothetical protein